MSIYIEYTDQPKGAHLTRKEAQCFSCVQFCIMRLYWLGRNSERRSSFGRRSNMGRSQVAGNCKEQRGIKHFLWLHCRGKKVKCNSWLER